MREHQGAVPWLRLSMEGAAIVLSILLAFGIDAGWDLRAQLNEEREVLIGLRAEFEDVGARLAAWAEFNAVSDDILSRALAADPGTLSHPLADSAISAGWLVNIIDRGGGPLDALLASGRLELIRERRIRERIARWPDRMEDLHTNDLGLPTSCCTRYYPHSPTSDYLRPCAAVASPFACTMGPCRNPTAPFSRIVASELSS
jgi:hypothetical protein